MILYAILRSAETTFERTSTVTSGEKPMGKHIQYRRWLQRTLDVGRRDWLIGTPMNISIHSI
jgi:hypothetical protein